MSSVSVFKQSGLSLVLQWSLMPLEFIVGVLVARSLGPEGKGFLVILLSLTGTFNSLSNFGITYGVLYLYREDNFSIGQIIFSALFIVTIPIVICAFAYFFFSDTILSLLIRPVVNNFNFNLIWIPLLNIFFLRLLSVGDVLLIKDNEMKLYIMKSLCTVLLRITFTYILALKMSLGIPGVLFSQLFASSIGLIIPVSWLINKKNIFEKFTFSLKATKNMFLIGFKQYGNVILSIISKRFEIFMIAGMLSIPDAGFFGVAASIYYLFISIPQATMWPLASKLSGSDDDRESQFKRVTRVQFTLMLFLICLITPFIPFFIRFFYGEAFQPAVVPLLLLLPGIIACPLIISSNAYFASRGEPGRSFLPIIISTSVQVIVSLNLIPILGVSGGAIGITINSIFMALIQVIFIIRDGEIKLSEILLMTREDWNVLYKTIIDKIENHKKDY